MLARRAADFRDDHTVAVNSWPEFVAAVAGGWALALHCGEQACEDEIKAETTATPRCIPLDGEPGAGYVRALRQTFRLRQEGDLRPRLLSLNG